MRVGVALICMMVVASGCELSKKKTYSRGNSHELFRSLAKEIDGGGVDNVRLLISKGADVNYRGNQNWTPVMIASRYSYREIVELLIQEGAEVNVSNNFGRTPLYFAKTPEIKQLLIDAGAKE
ncbi:MAG: ankyrin repeat domain-containing protein [Planctomycetia bacterium]|nr:ankyrin repeat domain-containing protein [Planctomycetia bacterium]MBL6914141.1 ankyrin repeat domain-containing protein [Planctomycetota bacterium]